MAEYIDIYCERTEPGFWAEPINALTNLSFFIAAFFIYLFARRENSLGRYEGILIALLCCIGVGSTLFHTFASKTTMLSDVLPILFYQIAFISFYSLIVMKLTPLRTAFLFLIFIVGSVLFNQIPSSFMNGSLSYAPALLFLIGFGYWHAKNIERERLVLVLASGVFALSLTFRSIDMIICPNFEIGTHFLWHILNGVVLYLTARGFVYGRL